MNLNQHEYNILRQTLTSKLEDYRNLKHTKEILLGNKFNLKNFDYSLVVPLLSNIDNEIRLKESGMRDLEEILGIR